MLAMGNGHIETVMYLVRSGADVNAADTLGRTALHRGVRGVSRWWVMCKVFLLQKSVCVFPVGGLCAFFFLKISAVLTC